MTDQLPSKEHVHSYHMGRCTPCLLAQVEWLTSKLRTAQEDLHRTESARVAILAENTHYKQRAADLEVRVASLGGQVEGYKQAIADQVARAAQPPGAGQ